MWIVRVAAVVLACAAANAPAMAAVWVLKIDAYATGQQFVANCDGSIVNCTFTRPWSEGFSFNLSIPEDQLAIGPVSFSNGFEYLSGRASGVITLGQGVLSGTNFSFTRISPAFRTCGQICFGSYEQLSAQTFSVTFVSSQGGPGPVPEPATWVMLLAGFFSVGFALRARRLARVLEA